MMHGQKNIKLRKKVKHVVKRYFGNEAANYIQSYLVRV